MSWQTAQKDSQPLSIPVKNTMAEMFCSRQERKEGDNKDVRAKTDPEGDRLPCYANSHYSPMVWGLSGWLLSGGL